ncbi:MAG: DUF362 domain-containing protein, partial [Myxococcales bacterium]|nr:DUF362 domain-containing protein [Myxococcales bacterium]
MSAAASDSDPLIREFRDHLQRLRATARSPGEELDALLLVGVEREALVTVAYHDDAVAARLARMPVDEEVRAIVARAVRWVWRDEEGHTLWVRGALLRRHEPLLRARALGAQVGGWIAGFVASSQAHHTWREAPLRRALAELVEASAALAGKIPPEVREHLHHLSFRDFCRFQAAAETTAMLGWERAAELSADPSTGVPLQDGDGFRRLAEDEGRHAHLFAVLADAFDGDDRALIDAATLRARIAAVGQRFLARPDAAAALANPLGKGAEVVVRTGEDPRALVEDVLERSGLVVPRGARIVVKTTLQLVTRRADPSPGVSVALLAALRQALLDRGADVVVLDAPNLYTALRSGRSVDEVRRWLGVPFPIEDAQADQVPHAYPRGVGEDTVSAAWRDADLRVLFGKLRSHPTSSVMASLEAAEGLGARDDDVLFADRRAERETATLMVLDAFPAHLCLVDAWDAVPDGLLGMMGTTRPLAPRRLYASRDGVALDRVVARHVGVPDDDRGLLVHAAEDWFGRPAPEVDGDDTPIAGFRLPDHDARTALLSSLAWPVWTWAGLRGALFAPEFDDAFPPREDAHPGLHAAVAALRALVRKLVSDEPPPRWPGLLPTERITVRGHGVRVARAGAGERCFVLLHGYPDDLQIWSALAPLLAPH